PQILKLTGDWTVAGVNLRAFGAYIVSIAGTGLIMYGFALAFQSARSRTGEVPWAPLAQEPALG
ncbi:MAG: hypothetical protein H0V43_01175, partial [Gemmatimonadales bacterium]|nr:hypothetical protein [Gemmatimonadales bacterium]